MPSLTSHLFYSVICLIIILRLRGDNEPDPDSLSSSFARCDRRNDCGDSSDEQGCTYQTCQQHQFTCQNGRCVSHDFVCDGDNDCGDESDELEHLCRTPAPTCPPAEFRCDNGHCVPLMQVCDRNDDCSDNSDEKGCGESERILRIYRRS